MCFYKKADDILHFLHLKKEVSFGRLFFLFSPVLLIIRYIVIIKDPGLLGCDIV
jgi:hypothetical protein